MSKLIDACLEQIKEDCATHDLTAIEELLERIPPNILVGYISVECIDCGEQPLVFENDGSIKGAREWESDPDTGEKRCFKCHCKKYPDFPNSFIRGGE
jgi:hypothetical protein